MFNNYFSNAIYKTALRLGVKPRNFNYTYNPEFNRSSYEFSLNGNNVIIVKFPYDSYELSVPNNPNLLLNLNAIIANTNLAYVGYDFYELPAANAIPSFIELPTYNALVKALNLIANN